MPSYKYRAGRIELALVEYRDPNDDASLTELLTDALHYGAIHDKDFEWLLKRAKRQFAFECQLDDDQPDARRITP
jgi:hypothetical protein